MGVVLVEMYIMFKSLKCGKLKYIFFEYMDEIIFFWFEMMFKGIKRDLGGGGVVVGFYYR